MKEVAFYIVTPWKAYPVHIWTPAPAHGDLTTDAAFVLAQVGRDADRIAKEQR